MPSLDGNDRDRLSARAGWTKFGGLITLTCRFASSGMLVYGGLPEKFHAATAIGLHRHDIGN